MCLPLVICQYGLGTVDFAFSALDYEFPADLEQSFISGALNYSTSTVTLSTHLPTSQPTEGSLPPMVPSPHYPPHDHSTEEDFKLITRQHVPGCGGGLKKYSVISSTSTGGPASRIDSDMKSMVTCAPVVPNQEYLELVEESIEEGLCA